MLEQRLITKAENDLKGMLKIAGVPKKPSYSSGEVRAILGFSESTFWRLVNKYEVNPENGQPRHPCSLDSFKLQSSRRVRFDELAEFLARNNSYEKVHGDTAS